MYRNRSWLQEVHGELYEVDSEMLKVLDQLERHPTWIVRTPTQSLITKPLVSELTAGTVVDCEIYILHKDHVTEELRSMPCISNYSNSTSSIKYSYVPP